MLCLLVGLFIIMVVLLLYLLLKLWFLQKIICSFIYFFDILYSHNSEVYTLDHVYNLRIDGHSKMIFRFLLQIGYIIYVDNALMCYPQHKNRIAILLYSLHSKKWSKAIINFINPYLASIEWGRFLLCWRKSRLIIKLFLFPLWTFQDIIY